MSLPSLPDGSNSNSLWQLNKESSTNLYHSLGESVCFFPFTTANILSETEHFSLLQFISSLASSQSTFWLHLLELEMQPPSLHWNWSAVHSVADKHTRKRLEFNKTNVWIFLQAERASLIRGLNSLLQKISSELSPQSSCPLHQELCPTQRPFTHRL